MYYQSTKNVVFLVCLHHGTALISTGTNAQLNGLVLIRVEKGQKQSSWKRLLITDHNLRIWYSNFGSAGNMNDINVLDKSSIIQDIVTGRFDLRTRPYNINGVYRDYMYFLVDGI